MGEPSRIDEVLSLLDRQVSALEGVQTQLAAQNALTQALLYQLKIIETHLAVITKQ